MKIEFVCPKCRRHVLLFGQLMYEPTCRHGQRWRLIGSPMRRI